MYDSEEWEEIGLQNEAITRSLVYHKDTIFIGSYGEFGIFTKNEKGKWSYSTLTHLIKEDLQQFSDVWNVHVKDNHVLFQTHHYIFDLAPDRKTIVTTYSEKEIANAFLIDNRYFLHITGWGICDFIDGGISKLTPEGVLPKARINAMIKNGDGYLLFTSSHGAMSLHMDEKMNRYTFKEFGFRKDSLKNEELYAATTLQNGLIAVAARGTGLFFMTTEGNVVNKITKETELIDENILCLFVDRQGNLWVGTSNGISKIEINSSVSTYDDLFGLGGTVEDIIRFRDTLFVATHSGLHYFDEKVNRFVNCNATHLECYELEIVNIAGREKLLVALNDGMYEYSSGGLKLIQKCYPWDCMQNPAKDNEVIVACEGSLGILTYSDSGWNYVDTSQVLTSDFRNLSWLKDRIWSGSRQRGLYSFDPLNIYDNFKIYGNEHGLPQNSVVPVIYQDEIYLGTHKGLYVFNNGDVQRSPILKQIGIENLERKDTVYIHRMATDSRDQLWLVTHNDRKHKFDIGYIKTESDGSKVWKNSDFAKVSEEVIHAIYHDEGKTTWLGGVKGVYKYSPTQSEADGSGFPVYITSIRNRENEDSIVSADLSIFTPEEFEYKKNNIWLSFAAASFFGEKDKNAKSRNEYSFYLEGASGEENQTWCEWKKTREVNYQNLDEGTYIFHLKARDFYGHISEELTYTFKILPPWYRTIWAYTLYVLLFIIVIYAAIRLSIRRVKKQNERLEEVIKERTAEVVRQKEEIEIQKELVDEKNRDILDSIKYAERIQTAILPPQKLVHQTFKDAFVLFKPKDIVSGDFYWMEVIDDAIYFAAVDCTGHGVPGAMVSVVGHNGLNRCVKEFGLTTPAKILDKLTQLVEETFEKSENQMRDGMDIGLCKVHLKTRVVEYAGANNPLWIISKNEHITMGGDSLEPSISEAGGHLFEVKADKQPIGWYENRKPYTNHTLQLNENDRAYLFSDGYADQFGGPKGKKLKYKPFKQLLLSTLGSGMNDQMAKIDSEFEQWKGRYEQVDDVCVFGIQL